MVQSAAFQLTKPTLNRVQPRSAGGYEVKLEPGMFFQLGFHFCCFVSLAVIQNHMKVLLFRCFSVNLQQKIEKLFGAMACVMRPITSPFRIAADNYGRSAAALLESQLVGELVFLRRQLASVNALCPG